MANITGVHAVENSEDLLDCTLIGFGGDAALHAAPMCEKLGFTRCLIPQGAGVGSAIGLGSSHGAGIYDRAAFAPGHRIAGPAIITEDETTIVLPASRQAMAL